MKRDPTRTVTLRRSAAAETKRRYVALARETRKLLVQDDAFSTQWDLHNDAEKLDAFTSWFEQSLDRLVLGRRDAPYWSPYIVDGYRKGSERAYYTVRGSLESSPDSIKEFMGMHLLSPTARQRRQLIAAKVGRDLRGVNEAVLSQVSDQVIEGLIREESPKEIYKRILDRIHKIGVTRSEIVMRSEIVRSHAEGQLDSFETLGVEEITIAVEWDTAENPCKLCANLDGIVLTLKEARGMIPRHPRCQCAWLPATVRRRGMILTKDAIKRRVDESINLEKPGRALSTARKNSRWAGKSVRFSKRRPLGARRA